MSKYMLKWQKPSDCCLVDVMALADWNTWKNLENGDKRTISVGVVVIRGGSRVYPSMDGYSQHIRQKLKENQFLLLLSS